MSMIFEDLEAWKKARQLVNAIYTLTHDATLARDFGLSGQIQRAAVSVMSNVAEGFERGHSAEKLQAYNVARASCGEVRSLLYVIEDNYPTNASLACETRKYVGNTGALISGLIASTRRRFFGKIAGSTTLVAIMVWIGSYLLR